MPSRVSAALFIRVIRPLASKTTSPSGSATASSSANGFGHPLPAPGRADPLHGVQAKQGQHASQQHPRPQQDGALAVLRLRHFERSKVKPEEYIRQRPYRRFILPPLTLYLGMECLEDHERP